MVDRVLRLPLMAEARTSSRVLREVPTGPEGRADLVFETPVGWRVVEFKTNREDDAGHHGPQVLAYAARIAAATQRKAVASICQVRTATVTEIVAGA